MNHLVKVLATIVLGVATIILVLEHDVGGYSKQTGRGGTKRLTAQARSSNPTNAADTDDFILNPADVSSRCVCCRADFSFSL
jgi:hypothetical protein